MTRVEATDAVVLEYPCDGLFTDVGSLLERRHGLEQIQEPVRADVVSKLQHQWIIAPELVLQTVGEADVLNLELSMRDHSLSSTIVGSAMESLRNARMSVLRLSASTSASRLSSLAPETVKRSRKRSSCLGLTE